MTVKGIDGWTKYLTSQLDLKRENKVWGNKYTFPPESGSGYIEHIYEDNKWSVWISDFIMEKELITDYAQDDPYYIGFALRETSYPDVDKTGVYPDDDVIKFHSIPGTFLKAVGVFYFTSYFSSVAARDIADFISSIQAYDDDIVKKKIKHVLLQIREYRDEGISKKVFVESKVLELISILIKMAEEEKNKEFIALSTFDTSQIHKAMDILKDNMVAPPKITELSRMLMLNEHKLKAGFRHLFGITIYEYLTMLRMEKASDLLTADKELSIGEIGLKVGYKTPHGFTNAFKKYYGVTPVIWRNTKKNQCSSTLPSHRIITKR